MTALAFGLLATGAIRGAWIATVDNIDWPPKVDRSPTAQRAAMEKLMDHCASSGLTDVFFQVRPAGDALFPSQLEPWSEYLTGRQGHAPNPIWDPLQTMIDLGKAKGIRVHAWINPFRAKHPSAVGPLAPNHMASKSPSSAVAYSKLLWFDPSLPAVRQRTVDVAVDLVKRYPLAGIHIDDYFYPYPVAGVSFGDGDRYQAYRRAGGNLSLGAWRRSHIDRFVRDLHQAIKAERRDCMFSISPFGIYRPGVPKGIEAGLDAFEALAADPIKWTKEGWCDLLIPQLYWPDGGKQSFSRLLAWWRKEVPPGVAIAAGLYTSKLSPEEIRRQIDIVGRSKGIAGYVHFSAKALPPPKQSASGR
jgi:uncharacterized lipoprotein YddW (UPF0748 family)